MAACRRTRWVLDIVLTSTHDTQLDIGSASTHDTQLTTHTGHMYAYFRFFARDLVLIWPDRVLAWRKDPDGTAEPDSTHRKLLGSAADAPYVVADRRDGGALAKAVWEAYPCPFYGADTELAYHHFTGNTKPWSRYKPKDARFAAWYEALAEAGVDVQQALFSS